VAEVAIDVIPPENDPQILCAPPEIAVVGSVYRGRICSFDADGTAVEHRLRVFDAPEVPDGAEPGAAPTVDLASGLVTWDPVPALTGQYTLELTVTDPTGRTASRLVAVDVVDPVIVPDVVGDGEPDAGAAIDAAGLRLGRIVEAHDPAAPAGTVTSQEPPGGSAAAPGTRVDLVVSLGPEPADEDQDGDGFSVADGDPNDDPPSESDPGGVVEIPTPPPGAPTLVEILLNPVNPTLIQGGSLTLSAIGAYLPDPPALGDVRSTQDVRLLGTWTTEDPAVATVDRGVLTAVGPGETTVEVTLDGKAAERTVVVLPAPLNDRVSPIAQLTQPTVAATIAAPVELRGRATDANPGTWRIELVDGNQTVALVAEGVDQIGEESGADGSFGTLDPALVLPGTWQLRLVVTDAAGNWSATQRTVTIESSAAIGAFEARFVDLLVPTPGLPLQVVRRYDTRDDRVGDFGRGWRLETSGLRVSRSGIQGRGWESVAGRWSFAIGSTGRQRITITLPSGKIEHFDMTVSPSVGTFVPIQTTQASYVPAVGTTGQLRVLDNTNLLVFGSNPGEIELVDDTTFRLFNPQRFEYAAADGTRYRFGADGRVDLITDPNRNTITIDANGITHSAGPDVVFERDVLGRITAIEDAAGNRQTYRYDSGGNLASHTDAAGNVTTYRYTGRHDLVEIIDPLGRVVDRREYDEDGRLIAVTNPSTGERVTFDRDGAARREIVTDADDNQTVFAYDERGNVIEVVDALGGRTTSTFDAAGNALTVTDPLGHTTTRTYDANGNVLTETDPTGRTIAWTYDERGRVTSVTQGASTDDAATTSYRYDAAGNLVETVFPDGSRRTAAFDARGNLVRVVEPDGSVATATYSPAGFLTSETGPDGRTIAYGVDAVGSITSVTDPTGATTTFEVDARGLPVEVTDPAGRTSTIEWAPNGSPVAVTDPDGTRTAITIDAADRITSLTATDGASFARRYDVVGRLDQFVDPAGRTTTFTYDALGRQTEVRGPTGVASRVYDAAGRTTSVSDASGTTTFGFDDAGRITSQTDATGRTTTLTYDDAGRLVGVVDPTGDAIGYTLDEAGRTIAVTYPDGTAESIEYDALGRVVRATEAAGESTAYEYDAAGRITAVVDALGHRAEMAYDAGGRLASITDARGHSTRHEYDPLGRLVRTTHPNGSVETFVHDDAGRIVEHIDANGGVTRTTYDDADRPLAVIHPDGSTTTTTWSVDGLPTSVTETIGGVAATTTYQYDAAGRPRAILHPDGSSTTYAHDEATGRLIEVTATAPGPTPAGTTRSVQYAWDAAGRLATVTDRAPGGAVRTATHTYDDDGLLAQIVRSNGVVTSIRRDPLGRPVNVTHRAGEVTLVSHDVTLDARGDVTALISDFGPGAAMLGEPVEDRTATFTYDELRRITSERHVAGDGEVLADRAYTYDEVGNRTGLRDGTDSWTLTYGPGDRLLQRTGADGITSFVHDPAGNLLSASGPTTQVLHGYDARHRNVISTVDGTATRSAFDHAGRRVRLDGTNLLVDPLALTGVPEAIAEYDNAGAPTAWLTFGEQLLTVDTLDGAGGITTQHPLTDLAGSVTAVTDAAGVMTGATAFDAFGRTLFDVGTSTVRQGFHGQVLDPTGLVHLRARQYDPSLGRFTAADPWAGALDDPTSLHDYQFAHHNPFAFTDPTGLYSLSQVQITVAIQAGLGAAVGWITSPGERLKGALFGAVSGAAGAAAGVGITAAAVGRLATGPASVLIARLAAVGGLDMFIGIARVTADTLIGAASDCLKSGCPSIGTFTSGLVIGIGLEILFSRSSSTISDALIDNLEARMRRFVFGGGTKTTFAQLNAAGNFARALADPVLGKQALVGVLEQWVPPNIAVAVLSDTIQEALPTVAVGAALLTTVQDFTTEIAKKVFQVGLNLAAGTSSVL
jgi:RHS repeat-associated protein